ncbi:MAG: prepilin-type N-terminal cleavage/methylation domain-containing protein [Thiobacillaceae bacterium]
MSLRKQQGFTLIEIAIVLVIIGLLLGGILQGQSLINSARVRNLISQVDGVKAAFYGFQDRYRALPGDFSQADTQVAGVAAGVKGNGNGQIEAVGALGTTITESIAVWDHLSHAGFITGAYTYNATESQTTTPTNPWGAYIQLIYDDVYAVDSGTATPRHNLKTGNQVPVEVIAEVDRKIDDGNALRGIMRFSAYANGGTAPVDANCYDTNTGATKGLWSATSTGQTNCGAAILF